MVSIQDVRAAAEWLEGRAVRTPVLNFPAIDALVNGRLFFKMESFQHGGAFKFRGAFFAIARQLEEARKRGVVTGSSGNHGTAVALAAKQLGVRATVVMPEDAANVKLDLVRAAGGQVVICGRTSDERLARARDLAEKEKMLMVPPYDHEFIIAGQGTVALEIIEQVEGVEVVLIPCGGGGLTSGCAVALAALKPAVDVYAVEAESANDTWLSWQQGERVRIDLPDTLADGMRNLIPGALTFPLIKRHCRGVLLATERGIREAVRKLFQVAKLVVEPTGAVPLAALLERRIDLGGRTAVAVVSGGNIDPRVLALCLAGD